MSENGSLRAFAHLAATLEAPTRKLRRRAITLSRAATAVLVASRLADDGCWIERRVAVLRTRQMKIAHNVDYSNRPEVAAEAVYRWLGTGWVLSGEILFSDNVALVGRQSGEVLQ